MTLRDASISSGYIRAEDFDRIVVPANMVGNPDTGLEYLITLSNM
jgi:fumarate hydratase class II